MLTLPIKKKWFDMILSGEKKEEYREIKPYYMIRFRNMMSVHPLVSDNAVIERLRKWQVGTGKEEWGAEKGKEHFILTVQEILKGSDIDGNTEENTKVADS